jgi:hypothetical protein
MVQTSLNRRRGSVAKGKRKARSGAMTDSLTSWRSRQFSRNVGKIAAYLAEPETGRSVDPLVQAVDFPEFVAQLLHGVFNAIVDASIQQMDAYADLVKDLARATDQFAGNTAIAVRARDRLIAKYPDLLSDDDGDDPNNRSKAATPGKRFPKANRQQLLATMVLMGINRIVVTSGQVRARRRRR